MRSVVVAGVVLAVVAPVLLGDPVDWIPMYDPSGIDPEQATFTEDGTARGILFVPQVDVYVERFGVLMNPVEDPTSVSPSIHWSLWLSDESASFAERIWRQESRHVDRGETVYATHYLGLQLSAGQHYIVLVQVTFENVKPYYREPYQETPITTADGLLTVVTGLTIQNPNNPIIPAVLYSAQPGGDQASTALAIRVPTVLRPTDDVDVYLDLTSVRRNIAAIGCRLTYDPIRLRLLSLLDPVSFPFRPSSWSLVYEDTTEPGRIDLVMTDVSQNAVVIDEFNKGVEIAHFQFERVEPSCAPVEIGFSDEPPAPGTAEESAFPENQYIMFVDPDTKEIATETAGRLVAATGPVVVDRAFLRGNVNARFLHSLDIGDVVDLVAFFFGGYVPDFDCQAAFDVTNDGEHNIGDIVTLVQAVFGTLGVVVPAPTGAVPEVGVPDGGEVPSVLGCREGEGACEEPVNEIRPPSSSPSCSS